MSELDFYLVADEPNNDQNQSTYLKGTGEKRKVFNVLFHLFDFLWKRTLLKNVIRINGRLKVD